jgi:hypothetical protein
MFNAVVPILPKDTWGLWRKVLVDEENQCWVGFDHVDGIEPTTQSVA